MERQKTRIRRKRFSRLTQHRPGVKKKVVVSMK